MRLHSVCCDIRKNTPQCFWFKSDLGLGLGSVINNIIKQTLNHVSWFHGGMLSKENWNNKWYYFSQMHDGHIGAHNKIV